MKLISIGWILILVFHQIQCFVNPQLNEMVQAVKGKRIGLITNPTGVDDDLVMITDSIGAVTQIKKFFSPEHGLRGDQQAGAKIEDYIDPLTGIQVISLYGSKKAPSASDLQDIDTLVYYIRDVGTRFYTFIWTMTYCMEAAQQNGKEFIIIDTPNPLGRTIEGCRNEMDAGLVGRKWSDKGVPQRYGLTTGELANFINKEWLQSPVNLKVIGYKQESFIWILPSPNMPTRETALVYPGFGIVEGTDLSEGRGTTRPFEIIGAPNIVPEWIAESLNKLKLPGVIFRPLYFTPTFSKHANKLCGGIQVHVTNSSTFQPFRSALHVLEQIMKTYPITFNAMINLETGILDFQTKFKALGAEGIYASCQTDTNAFIAATKKYLIY